MPVISRYSRALLPLALIAFGLSEATAFAQGALTNGDTHTGTIATPGQIDVWTFSAAQGNYIALEIAEIVANPDPGFMPYMRLVNHDTGEIIMTVTGALAAQIAVNAASTATYDVFVRDSNINRPGTALGSYTVTLVKAPGALVVPTGDQGGAMTNGGNHAGSIFAGDLDAWTFTAAKDDYIALSIAEVLELDPMFRPWIRLLGPDGGVIGNPQGALAAHIAARAPLSGVYTVVVSDSAENVEPSHQGNYILRLVKTGAPVTVPVGDEGGAMLPGANYVGAITIGDLDPYTFTALPGDYIAIKIGEVVLSQTDPFFMPWIRLIGPDGAVVLSVTGDLTAAIAATATLSGTYTLLVADSGLNREPSHEGSYLLTMFRAPGTFVVPPGDHGGTLLNNVTRSGAIYSGDLDEWRFAATSGHALTVTVTDVIADPAFSPWIRLIGPTGSVVAQVSGVTTATINIVSLAATGVYTVIVGDNDINHEGSAIGNYTITAIGVDPNVCDSGAVAGITTIRAIDVVSLRDRINSVRGHYGVPLFSFTDADLVGAPVKTTHFVELRSALQDAYIAAGQAVPTYTDPVLTPLVTFIKAVHVNELCVAVAFLE